MKLKYSSKSIFQRAIFAVKMMALKWAYADIILNPTKEVAARIMAFERRALRFQQELSSTKDESLRMLVHMKQMIDSKESMVQCKNAEDYYAKLSEKIHGLITGHASKS